MKGSPATLKGPTKEPIHADAALGSTPETVLWGYLAANLPPALTVKSGETVAIEALSHQGLTTGQDPENFLPPTAFRPTKFSVTPRGSLRK